MRWVNPPINEHTVQEFSRSLGLSRPASRLLSQLGLPDAEAARRFLDPRLANLEDPFRITHMEQAVDRLLLALRRNERILVFGDYDVDGVTSTTLLVSTLHRFAATPHYVVPLRLEEGYGLSRDAIERALSEFQPQLFIAVDCGTSSRDSVALLRERGIEVIILDHHTSKEALPADCILVNPHVHDPEDAPWRFLCSVGLVFKFVHGLIKKLRDNDDQLAHEFKLKDELDLVALGTISDLVPLTGENRILARAGLEKIRTTSRIGLCALLEVGGMRLGEEVSPFDISFRLGPRINASGRLANAASTIDMFLSTDWARCRATARALDDFNRSRQDIERAITAEADAMVEAAWSNAPGLILYAEHWHPGVVGIVASRISQKYHRPTIILGREGAIAKGSGRSAGGVDLVEVLKPCSPLIDKWGGHPMAVGVSVDPANIDALREQFSAAVLGHMGGSLPEKEVRISSWIEPDELDTRLLNELDALAPFGPGNPDPVFALRGARLRAVETFGRAHVRARIAGANGDSISLVAWNGSANPPPADQPVDLAFRFGWNVWNGTRTPRATLIDWRRA